MLHQTLVRIVAVSLSLSLAALPASHASELGHSEPTGKTPQTQSAKKAEDKPKQAAESSAAEAKPEPCVVLEAATDEEKSVTPEFAAEPEKDDPAVDFYDNVFKLKSITAGELGPAGFLKGAKTESRDHGALIAASEKRQGAATCRRAPSSQEAPKAAAADEKREKVEKSEPKSSPPPDGL
jgi:hypothetical protein